MPSADNGGQFSKTTGLIFIFNLIVGTGALALPGAFAKAGWILGLIIIVIVGVASFISVTFIIETLAVVNAIQATDDDEDSPLVTASEPDEEDNHACEIINKYELSEMASLLLDKPARIIVYICLLLYLFGDLSIYTAVVSTTLSHVTCTYRPLNFSCNATVEIPYNISCWENYNLTREDAYRIYVCLFNLLLGPFVFFNLQKTKFLQILTSVMRSFAFLTMIIWSIQKLIVNGSQNSSPLFNFHSIPALFGTCIYSFMCHHSIPGLIQPIADKKDLRSILTIDFIVIALFYVTMALTAIFTFSHVEDLYTLNFWIDTCNKKLSGTVTFLDYYLALFPVFTLSTNFPIIAITLKNNCKKMFPFEGNFFIEKIIYPMLTIIAPTILALSVSNLQLLVGIIGSYTGAGVQYLIPCILVTAARSQASNLSLINPYVSIFSAKFWVFILYLWTTVALIFISIKYVTDI